MPNPRLAVRALIVENGRLLLVNSYPGTHLWCAPGGGAEVGEDLCAGLVREVREETGLTIQVGGVVAIDETYYQDVDLHQVDIYFAAQPLGALPADWTDPEGTVVRRAFVSRDRLAALQTDPRHLPSFAFQPAGGSIYRGLTAVRRT